MSVYRSHPRVDTRDETQLWTWYETMRAQLSTEFGTWRPTLQQIAEVFMPRNQRFNYSTSDVGWRMDGYLVDNTGTYCLDVMTAGIMSIMANPADRWYRLRCRDPKLNERSEVANYWDAAQDALDDILLESNYYSTLLGTIKELGGYGTGAFNMTEDDESVIRCYPYPIGSYYISGNDTQRIDLIMRVFQMTTRQLVEKFGMGKLSDKAKKKAGDLGLKEDSGGHVSQAVMAQYEAANSATSEIWWPVVHVVHRDMYYDATKKNPYVKPWVSVYYEMGPHDTPQALLRRSGFDSCPIIVGRWSTVGENFYGDGAAIVALGDARELQLLQRRKSQAIDKQVNPPMVASPALQNQAMSVLPGKVTFVDPRNGDGFKPAYQVQFDIAGVTNAIQDCRSRISDALYKSLFLMHTDSDRREITAEEIRAKQQEKMLVLGPVAHRLETEVLGPSIERAFEIALKAGKLPPLPQVLKGQKYRVEFESLLARAQRIARTGSVDRLMAFLGSEIGVQAGVADNVDLDAITIDYAKDLGIRSTDIRDAKARDAMRKQRAYAQQQQQAADVAQKSAMAAKTLSQTPLNTGSALDKVAPQLGQGGAPQQGAA